MNHISLLKKLSIGLHYFIGFGAIAGGFGAVSNPTAPMGISTDMLKNGPFDDFLIPGLFLMIVIGLGNVIAGTLAIKSHKWWAYLSGAMGDILIMWLVIQCFILSAIEALHVIFFTLGAVQGFCALLVLINEKKIPFNKM